MGTDYCDLACLGLTFVPPGCAAWLLEMGAYGPINVFEFSKGLFPTLTGLEPPFEEAFDWLQFTYTTDPAGAYVEPASTVLTWSAVAKGDKLFSAFLSNLRRLYPEVFCPTVFLGQAPECREFLLREGYLFSGGTSVTSFSKLGSYVGRYNNLIIARMNKPSPNLTNVYLDTPIVGLTPDSL